jgi:predicted transcriptional regulator YdeE
MNLSENNVIKDILVTGYKSRTINSNEVDQTKAVIPKMWNDFRSNLMGELKSDSSVFGVYFNYESDSNHEYDFLAGASSINKNELESVTVQKGKYLVFSNSGSMPQVIIDTWGEVWSYFQSADCKHVRTYGTDFEIYKDQSSIEVHISIE